MHLVGFAPTFYFEVTAVLMKPSVKERIKEIAAQIVEENGLELVAIDAVGTNRNLTIRVFIDKQGGVTHGDCSTVSRQFDAILDVEDFIPSAYLLEVSSPGIERGLYSLKDFERFIGSPAKVRTNALVNGQKNFRGRINAIENDEIVFIDKTGGEVRFPYNLVAKANLEIDLEEELKRSEKREIPSE